LQGLSHMPSLADVTGTRISVNLTRTGSFACSSTLITRIYDTTINNYLGLTTGLSKRDLNSMQLPTYDVAGGMSVDCPHRERR
jgi:hypothetical protein